MVNEKKTSRHFIQLKGNAYFWSIFKLSCEEFKDRAFSTVQFSADISHVKIV